MRLPLVVGVAGHRDIDLDRNEGLKSSIEHFFNEIITKFPNTPIYLLSSLAEGGDRIVADIAIGMGVQLVVPLPMGSSEYQGDFPDSVIEFQSLIDCATRVFVPPSSHTNRYASTARWVASHSHILLALWDENDYEDPPIGGTAYSVKLRTDPAFHNSLELMNQFVGPVYHIKTNRLNEEACVSHQSSWLEPCREVDTLKHFFGDLEKLNRGLLSSRQTQEPGASKTEIMFKEIDSEACKYQVSHLRMIQVLLLLSTIGFMFIASSSINTIFRYYGLMFVVVSIVGFYFHKKSSRYDFYLKLRAYAEALRVRLYFMRSSIDGNIPVIFGFSRNNNYWVGLSINSLEFLDDERSGSVKLDNVYVEFIKDQADYFSSKVSKLQRIDKYLSGFINMLFASSIVLQGVVLFAYDLIIEDFMVTSSCVLLVVIAAIAFYSDLRGFKEDTNRYQHILRSFKYYIKTWPELEVEDQKMIIRNAGLEVAAETKHWLLFHQTKKPDSFKG